MTSFRNSSYIPENVSSKTVSYNLFKITPVQNQQKNSQHQYFYPRDLLLRNSSRIPEQVSPKSANWNRPRFLKAVNNHKSDEVTKTRL